MCFQPFCNGFTHLFTTTPYPTPIPFPSAKKFTLTKKKNAKKRDRFLCSTPPHFLSISYITHSPKLRITCDQPWSQFKVTIFPLKKFSDPGIFSDRSGNAIPRLFAKKYCTLRSLNVCVR